MLGEKKAPTGTNQSMSWPRLKVLEELNICQLFLNTYDLGCFHAKSFHPPPPPHTQTLYIYSLGRNNSNKNHPPLWNESHSLFLTLSPPIRQNWWAGKKNRCTQWKILQLPNQKNQLWLRLQGRFFLDHFSLLVSFLVAIKCQMP